MLVQGPDLLGKQRIAGDDHVSHSREFFELLRMLQKDAVVDVQGHRRCRFPKQRLDRREPAAKEFPFHQHDVVAGAPRAECIP